MTDRDSRRRQGWTRTVWRQAVASLCLASCVGASCDARESSAAPIDKQECLCREAIRVCAVCCPMDSELVPYEICAGRIEQLLEYGSLDPSNCGYVLEQCEKSCPVGSDPCGR